MTAYNQLQPATALAHPEHMWCVVPGSSVRSRVLTMSSYTSGPSIGTSDETQYLTMAFKAQCSSSIELHLSCSLLKTLSVHTSVHSTNIY